MKKVILSLVLSVLTLSGMYANQLTIVNTRPCDFNFIFNMDNPSVHSQLVYIPTGNTVFPDGSAVVTTWSSPVTPAQMQLATFSSVMFHPIDPNPIFYGFLASTATTPYDSSPYAPACNGGTYNVAWFPSGPNAVILIY